LAKTSKVLITKTANTARRGELLVQKAKLNKKAERKRSFRIKLKI
jgi:hypothetical protein